MQINTTIGFVKEVPETYEDPSFWRAWYSLNIAMKIEVNVSERKQGWFFFFFLNTLLHFLISCKEICITNNKFMK